MLKAAEVGTNISGTFNLITSRKGFWFCSAMKTREERRTARAAIEEERRRVNGERAYRDWLRSSKNKPLPVPLNQGELSELFLI